MRSPSARHRIRRLAWAAGILAVLVSGSAAFLASALGAGGELSPLELKGREIFRTGTSPGGGPITAVLSESAVEVPAAAVPCAGCHGRDGRGRPEGGVAPSDLRWESLTKPYGVTHPSDRKHPAYDERTLKRAIAMGLDPAGNKLHVAMPRFRLTQEDMAALLAYLKRLGAAGESGVSDTALRVGVILPPPGPLAPMGRAVRAALEARAADWNGAGGFYGRRLELVFAEAAAEPAARRAGVAAFLDREKVFAVLGAFTAGADRELAELFNEREVPLVGPFTVHPRDTFPLDRSVFYLLSGLETQARVLAKTAARGQAGSGKSPLLVAPEGEAFDAAAADLSRDLETVPGLAKAALWRYARPGFDPPALARRLAEGKNDPVFFLGAGAELAALAVAADRAGLHPYLLATGGASDADLAALPPGFDGKVLLALPTLDQPNLDAARFAAAHHLPADQQSAQWTALAAAQILGEALKRAGRDLTRDSLIERLEELRGFDTGYAPPITYNAARRIGARGAYLLQLDLKAKTLRRVGEWVEID